MKIVVTDAGVRRFVVVPTIVLLVFGTLTAAWAQTTGPFDDPLLPAICDRQSSNVIVFDGAHYLTTRNSRYTLPLDDTNFDPQVGATYSVTLVSYDDHFTHPDTQEHETWRVELRAGNESVYLSPATADLPAADNWGTYLVDTEGLIDSAVDTAIAIHGEERNRSLGAESLWPVCAVFEPTTPGGGGDGALGVEKSTNGVDADDPFGVDVPLVVPGEDVTWTFTVSNSGAEPVSDVTVVDDQLGLLTGPVSGDADGDGLLDVGEVWLYSATGPAVDLTSAVDTVAGCPDSDGLARRAHRNIATVTGVSGGEDRSATDPSHYCNPIPAPGLGVEKSTNGVDADDPFGVDVPLVVPGEDVTWTFTVSNSGAEPVSDVTVVDDQLGLLTGPVSGDADGDGLLDVGEVWLYSATGPAVDLTNAVDTVAGCPDSDGLARRAHRNIATVTGVSGGEDRSATDPSHYCNPIPAPGLGVEKSTNGVDADDPFGVDVPLVVPGEDVTWTFTVSNSGAEPVSDVTVVDDQLGLLTGPVSGDADGDGLLDVGEVWLYSATGPAVDLTNAVDTVAGCPDSDGLARRAHRNIATVTGVSGGEDRSATDPSHYCNPIPPPPPGVPTVLITDTTDGPLSPDSSFTFEVHAANIGTVPTNGADLTVTMRDRDGEYIEFLAVNLSQTAPRLAVPILSPGAHVSFSVDARVLDSSATTVIAQVWEGRRLLDEEPIVLDGGHGREYRDALFAAVAAESASPPSMVGSPPMVAEPVVLDLPDAAADLAAGLGPGPAAGEFPAAGELPATGLEADLSARVALLMVGLGAVLVALTRRSRSC
jgi:hypothetical protein